MKVTILTQYYPPETGAPQRRLSDIAQRLYVAGHEVTVLTAMPNYPHGKIFTGYGGLFKREEHKGIRIIRTLIYPTQKTSFLHRLSNYFSFVISSALMGTFLLKRSDYLLVESPPLFLGLSAFWLSRIKRARLIFNVSDLWPESAVRLKVLREDSFAYHLSAWLERFCYRNAWLVTGQSCSMLDDIADRFPDRPLFHLSNGVDTNKFAIAKATDEARDRLTSADECVVLYAGLHGIAQGLDQVVDVADRVQIEQAVSADAHKGANICFVLIGDGPEKRALRADAEERRLNNLTFIQSQPAETIPALLASADILLVTLKMYIPGAVPSKLYEAMASERPVVLVATGEPADIVRTYRAGIVVEPGDIDGLTAAIKSLSAQPMLRAELGQNGRRAAEEHYNRDTIVRRFIQHLEANL